MFYYNIVPKTRRFYELFDSDLETQVRGHSRSLEPTRIYLPTMTSC